MTKVTTTLMIAAAMAAGWPIASAEAATTRVEKYFSNWKVECRDDEVNKSCALIYALLTRDTKRTVFSWTVIPDRENEGRNNVIVFTPFNVELANGISVRFSDSDPIVLTYKTCGSRGCVAEFALSDSWTKALTSQETMSVTFSPIRGNERNIEVNLTGFGDALDFYNSEMANR